MSARQLLNSLRFRDLIIPGEQIYFAYEDDPISVGIDCLVAHRLQSIPIRNRKTLKFTTFLDLVDVVYFSTRVMTESDILQGHAQGYLSFVKASEAFEKATCFEVARKGQPSGNAYVETAPHVTLRDGIAAMVHSNFAYQRVPVVDSHNELLGIVSQSRIIRECLQFIGKCSFASKKVSQVFQPKEVLGLGVGRSVSDALELIKSQNITAVAYTMNGALVGNFSASDIKRYKLDLSNMITQPLRNFLDTVEYPETIGYPVSVLLSTTMEELFYKFEISGVHRVYIIDNNKKPIGVVSTKDIIRLLLMEADGEEIELADDFAALKHSQSTHDPAL